MLKNLVVSCAALLINSVATSLTLAASPPADLSPVLMPIQAKHKAPGIVAAILEGDSVTALGAAGVRKAGSPEAFEPTDLVHIGSDTKAMTALLIAQLVDQKKLALSTSMAEIFADLAAAMNPAAAKITVEQLLCHTAGLPANITWSLFANSKKPLLAQRLAVAKSVLAAAPASEPGTAFTYSNTGYVLLGAILDRKAGRPWEVLIKDRLFKPLKMTTAGFGPPGTDGKIDQPWGHVLQNGVVTPLQVDNPPVMNSAGRVHCSISDWAKFVALFLDAPPNRKPLVAPATLGELLTPQQGKDYAGGWISTSRPWAGGTVYTHSGSNTTWYCTAWVAPKKNFATLVAINYGGDGASAICDAASTALIQFQQTNSGSR